MLSRNSEILKSFVFPSAATVLSLLLQTFRSIQSGKRTISDGILIFGVGSFNVAYWSIRRRKVPFATWAINMFENVEKPVLLIHAKSFSSGFDTNFPDDSPLPCFVPPGWLTALIYSLLMTSKVNWEGNNIKYEPHLSNGPCKNYAGRSQNRLKGVNF